MKGNSPRRRDATSPVYVLSGGTGSSGRQVAETALAQFPAFSATIVVRNHVRTPEEAEAVVAEARADGGIVVHTLVDASLREHVVRLGRERGVAMVDLMGPLLRELAELARSAPLGQPGLYRKTREEYFERIEAINFAVSHDDGGGHEGLSNADVVVLGVSRCGKTPLCMYLAAHGWKAANVPIIKDLPLPGEIFRLDRRNVVGLTIDHGRLLEHRRKREKLLGDVSPSRYSSPSGVFEELEYSNRVCREGGFSVVDVTDKPIEAIADEVVERVSGDPGKARRRRIPS